MMDMMTAKQAAEQMNGRQYNDEAPYGMFFKDMSLAGLVAVFGASDDLMEFRGAIDDEVDCYNGGTAYVTSSGLFRPSCDDDDCPHEKQFRSYASKIVAKFDEIGYTFVYETDIPHETFEIVEDDENYCRGLVFSLADVP